MKIPTVDVSTRVRFHQSLTVEDVLRVLGEEIEELISPRIQRFLAVSDW